MKVNFFFDYIYYRVADLYSRWDDSEGITGAIAVSTIKSAIVVELVDRVGIKGFFELTPGQWGSFAVGLFLLFLILDYRRYRRKFPLLKEHWKDESSSIRLIKGILVVLSVLFPWYWLLFD